MPERRSSIKSQTQGSVLQIIRSDDNDGTMKQLLLERVGEEAYKYFNHFIDTESPETLVVSTTNEFNILNHPGKVKAILNLSKVNNFRYINKFLEKVNNKLLVDDHFILCCETITARKERHSLGNIPFIRSLWFGMEFIFLRVFPKVWGLKKIYFLMTRGRNRLLSKAEVMGRLVSCGFKIEASEAFNGLTYIVTKKVKAPEFNMNVSYGPLFKMNRIGKNGKIIGVYKFRTMHPFAEYLQDYVLQLNGYGESGKPKNDFRLTPWGRFLRRYWLDELPQLINVLKGEMLIVGYRPPILSEVQKYNKKYLKRFQGYPGITSIWAIMGGHKNFTFDEWIRSDIEYEKKRSYLSDFKIILKTLKLFLKYFNK